MLHNLLEYFEENTFANSLTVHWNLQFVVVLHLNKNFLILKDSEIYEILLCQEKEDTNKRAILNSKSRI